ncbi:MAG: glycosyltransferase [Ignavibacteria bacterium]|nr:glycosyltransferase [Ignavibacteria bacterium]
MAKLSLIISFYNRIDYLKLVFAGLEIQTFSDFEVIIADDGSNENVVNQLQSLIKKLNFPVKHIWQEDKGFRKNKILNKAILTSETDYLVFIDGDCIPHSEFLKEHFFNREEKICLTGRRVNLSKKITDKLTEELIKNKFLERNSLLLFFDSIFGETVDFEKSIYLKSTLFRNFVNKKNRGLLGCNFSIHKKDIIEVNGFDERYIYPSIGEDSDLQFRLELNGVKIKSLNNIAIQYHLYHKLQDRREENLLLFEQVKNSQIAFTPYGIKKSIVSD